MDKVILNGNKARFYNEGNTQSGSIQYTDSKLSIKGNSAGSGVLITDGKLHLKSGNSTSSIVYNASTEGVQFPDGLVIIGQNYAGNDHDVIRIKHKELPNYSVSILIADEEFEAGYAAPIGSLGLLIGEYENGKLYGKYGNADEEWGMYVRTNNSGVVQQLTSSNIQLNTSIQSQPYIPGFDPTNLGNRGFAIKNVDNRYVAQFDDLYVRGAMNVHQMVINQIRATNGSLWVSDAAKAISASTSGNRLYLYFESGSTLPFQGADIIRSKRWIITDNDEISNWDIITSVFTVDYTNFIVTASIHPSECYTASNQSLQNLLQAAGSQWVRIGNLSNDDRMGGIYLTSGDNNSPYIDIYDGVQSIAQSHNQDSGSVHYDKLKVRLGKLQGVSLGGFTNMSGYGLYSDNVYLKGTIRAKAGTIGNWTISSGGLTAAYQEAEVRITPTQISFNDWNGEHFLIGTNSSYFNGYGIGYFTYGDYNPCFKVDKDGAFLSGTITSSAGQIGGWTIGTNQLYSGLVTISSLSNNKYFGIGASEYNTVNSIYLGSNSVGSQFSIRGTDTTGLYWDGTNLGVTTSNFTLSQGNITARNAVISGSISSSAGQIGGWSIEDQWLQNSSSNALIRLSTTSSYWDLINSQGVFNYAPSLHPQMYTLFTCSYDGFNTQVNQWGNTSIATGSFIQQEGGKPSQVYIQYTASYGNNRELLFYINTNSSARIIVPPKQTIFYSLEIRNLEASPIGGLGKMTPIELYSVMYTASGYNKGNKQNSEYLIGMAGENASFRIVSSYTNPSQDQIKVMSLGIYSRVKSYTETELNYKVAFTMSNVFVNNVKSVTQLSDKGLFLFGGPNKFLKIASDPTVPGSTQQYAVASLDIVNAGKLYVGGEQIRLGESGSIGGGIGGSGTIGYIPMFQDDTTIEDSPVYYDEDTIISQKPISAPAFTGSGFILSGTTTAQVGYLQNGTDVTGLGIKEIIESMLFYNAPIKFDSSGLGLDNYKTPNLSSWETTRLSSGTQTVQSPFVTNNSSFGFTITNPNNDAQNDNIDWSYVTATKLAGGTLMGISVGTTKSFTADSFPYYYGITSSGYYTISAGTTYTWGSITMRNTLHDPANNNTSAPNGIIARAGLRFFVVKYDGASTYTYYQTNLTNGQILSLGAQRNTIKEAIQYSTCSYLASSYFSNTYTIQQALWAGAGPTNKISIYCVLERSAKNLNSPAGDNPQATYGAATCTCVSQSAASLALIGDNSLTFTSTYTSSMVYLNDASMDVKIFQLTNNDTSQPPANVSLVFSVGL